MLVRSEKRLTLAGRNTALVIEGFPRSGNTFASAAFMVANGRDVPLGRHLHGAPHLLRAARLGVPAIALIRDPRDAVLSYVIRRPHLTVADALVEYVDFYRTAWKAKESFVIGRFTQVIEDFGSVIDEVNERFGTTFERYEATPEASQTAIELVEEMNREESGGVVVESQVGRPSAERAEHRQELAGLLDEASIKPHLLSAEEWFARYCERQDSR